MLAVFSNIHRMLSWGCLMGLKSGFQNVCVYICIHIHVCISVYIYVYIYIDIHIFIYLPVCFSHYDNVSTGL